MAPSSSGDASPSTFLRPLDVPSKIARFAIGLGVRAFFAWERLLYRLSPPWRGKLEYVDHVTIPCLDLSLAEEFYVGLLGARVVLRIDKPLLLRMGWSAEDVDQQRAVNLSVTLGGGPRLDLFEYPEGIPAHNGPMHPHIAFMVPAWNFLAWKRRLEASGVATAGPTRPGPKGQASLYFNDPFGNHLELITVGFIASDLPVGVPDRSRLGYAWSTHPRRRPPPC
jgi:catechol 2,3-dioxygenase-like lactoylglutathione lyase family enzyme